MKVFYLFIFSLILFHSGSGFAQIQKDSIEVRKKGGTKFLLNGNPLTPKQLLQLTSNNPAAYQHMKRARSNQGVASVIAYAGGFLVGWQLGSMIGAGTPNWTMAGVGAGLIGVSIPFSSAYTKHAKEAVALYNSNLYAATPPKVDFRMGLSLNQVSLKLSF
ncbi:hypothetical protein [Telluribacter sp. SYSU D00476]|uniref:hypothetical protein n=1 Tax=Telluribacter sp. SYSU D00476 TaxID=2811430 RepID=UPI001FF6321C|nr:hypothetical protein [Telluribacter sp. SYSU D00476]